MVMTLGAYVFFSGYLRIKASDQGMSEVVGLGRFQKY